MVYFNTKTDIVLLDHRGATKHNYNSIKDNVHIYLNMQTDLRSNLFFLLQLKLYR